MTLARLGLVSLALERFDSYPIINDVTVCSVCFLCWCLFCRANPVLNMNIDASTDLGFDEEGSSADRDR